MTSAAAVPASKGMLWTGRIMTGLVGAFLLLDGVMKLVKPEAVVKATTELGFPESSIFGMGAALTVGTLLYLVPRTAVLGAIIVTGYLGGAVATHVHAGHGAFEISFAVAFGVLLWGGIFLRDARLRALLPLVR